MRRQRCRKQRVADAAEGVAVGIGRLHEHRVGCALAWRLDRMVAQPQLVQDVREVYPWQPGECMTGLVNGRNGACGTPVAV
jgi:hypothetical protein